MMHIRRPTDLCNPQDTVWGDFVSFCCADLGGAQSAEVIVQLRVCDWNGNCNYLDAVILLEDKDGGSGSCPADVVLQCTV